MQREVPFSIEGIGFVPAGFYEQANEAIALIPDEWDLVVIGPQLDRDDRGHVTGYGGAVCYVMQAGRYTACLVETPQDLLIDERRRRYLAHVRHAFADPGLA